MDRNALPPHILEELERLEHHPRVDEPIEIVDAGHGVGFIAHLRDVREGADKIVESGDTPERAWHNFAETVSERLSA